VDEYYFDRMIVKYRKEIVALHYPVTPQEVEKFKQEASIEQVKSIIDNRDREIDFSIGHKENEVKIHGKPSEHVILLDMRNSYEYRLGHYKHAVPSGTVRNSKFS